MRNIKAISAIAPMIDPITMPAIAPPDKPLWDAEAGSLVEVDVGAEVPEAVDVEKVINPVIVGNTTPAQRSSAPEL
jgi:hypothetical protein